MKFVKIEIVLIFSLATMLLSIFFLRTLTLLAFLSMNCNWKMVFLIVLTLFPVARLLNFPFKFIMSYLSCCVENYVVYLYLNFFSFILFLNYLRKLVWDSGSDSEHILIQLKPTKFEIACLWKPFANTTSLKILT